MIYKFSLQLEFCRQNNVRQARVEPTTHKETNPISFSSWPTASLASTLALAASLLPLGALPWTEMNMSDAVGADLVAAMSESRDVVALYMQ